MQLPAANERIKRIFETKYKTDMETVRNIPRTHSRAVHPVRPASRRQPDEKPVNPRLLEAIELAEQQFRDGQYVECATAEELIAYLESL
jgi:hypothetical protein